MTGINITPDDPAAQLAKDMAPSKISDELTVTVRSVDELGDIEREKILGIKPARNVRVIPATNWFRKF